MKPWYGDERDQTETTYEDALAFQVRLYRLGEEVWRKVGGVLGEMCAESCREKADAAQAVLDALRYTPPS